MRRLSQEQAPRYVSIVFGEDAQILGHNLGVSTFELKGNFRAYHVKHNPVKILRALRSEGPLASTTQRMAIRGAQCRLAQSASG